MRRYGPGWWLLLLGIWGGIFPAHASPLPLSAYQVEVASRQMAEDLDRKLGQISGLFAALETMVGHGQDEATQHRALKRMIEAVPHVRAVLLVNGDGKICLDSATYPAAPIAVSDRDYFRHAQANPPLTLWLGSVVVGRSSSLPFIPVSSRVRTSDGDMVAVAVTSPDGLMDARFLCPMCSAALVDAHGHSLFGLPYGYLPSAELRGLMRAATAAPPRVTRVGIMDAVSFWRNIPNNNISVVYSMVLHD